MSRRLNVFLSDETDRRLALLKADGGFSSDAETIRAAIKWLDHFVTARNEDATVIVRDYTGVEREVVVPGGPPDERRAPR